MTTVAAVAGVGIVGALLLGLSNRQKTVIEQGKLSSRVWQGSEYGGDIPRIYGTVGIEGSQIVWLEHNKLKEKVKKKKSGGKGGGSSTTTKIYTYYATFALMLCQGEVAGIRRIWCGDKLIYNAGSDDLETIIASNQAAKGWKLYRGTDDQLPDPRYEADVGVGNAPAFRGYTYIAFYDFALADYSNTLQAAQFKVELLTAADAPYQSFESDRIPNYPSANNPDWNGQISYFSGESSLAYIGRWDNTYPFDVVPSGYKIKFVPRGQAPVVTIPWEDLAAANGEDIGDSLPYSREMDSQLPQKVTITALSSTREYGSSTQSSPGRPSTSAVNIEQRDIPLVLSDDEIAQMAEKLEMLRWLERDDFSYSLPPTYLALEPSDVVTVQAKFGTFELRLTEVNYESDGRLTCKAKANSAPLYTSRAVGAPSPGPSGTIPLEGPSQALLLDIPVVNETIQNTPGFVATMSGYTDGWSGGVLVQSPDGGQTWSELQGFDGRGTFGRVAGTLPASNCTVIDQRSIIVSLISGELESVTRDQMLAGVNYAAYGVDGRWEIVRFQNAAIQSDGTYLVSGFVRGQRGTEWATGLHQSGDWFILLDDSDNIFIGMPVESIGSARTYRAVTTGESIDTAADQPFTYRGVNLECLSPVYARGSRDVSSNFSGTFTRRSRLSSTWWTNGIVAPVGETSEAYQIDVMSGSTVKRTIPATSPAWSYSATHQTEDFGSPQSSITFRIFQMSNIVGRGYPLEVTL